MIRILVLTQQFPHADDKSLLGRTVDSMLERDHKVSILAGTGAGEPKDCDRRLAIRRQLLTSGLGRTLRNYLTSAAVSEVAMPEVAIAWDFAALTASPLRAAADYGATTLAYLTPDLAELAPGTFDRLLWPCPTLRTDGLGAMQGLGGMTLHAFATDAKVRDDLAAKGLPVKDAPVFSEDEVAGWGEDFQRWLGKARLGHRFARYEGISKYKKNPRPFMTGDA